MRFAIKTRPEHQTWEEIRDAWLAADEIPLFESAWNWDHFYPLSGDLTGPNFEAWAQQWNAIAQDPEDWLELKEVLVSHCADLGRDVNEITCSVNVRIEPDGNTEPVVAAAAAYRDAGADLVILNLPYHAKPESLKPLAEALGPLA